jgi:hypothetical protein
MNLHGERITKRVGAPDAHLANDTRDWNVPRVSQKMAVAMSAMLD